MKTGGTQVPIKKPNNRTKFKPGDSVVCIKSASCAYTEGRVYKVYKNDKGWTCITGDDGLEDIMSMLVSSFKKEP
jgi:hypothetical protein